MIIPPKHYSMKVYRAVYEKLVEVSFCVNGRDNFLWMILKCNDVRFKLYNIEGTLNDVHETPISKSFGATEKKTRNIQTHTPDVGTGW
jgi:hypothetical protein